MIPCSFFRFSHKSTFPVIFPCVRSTEDNRASGQSIFVFYSDVFRSRYASQHANCIRFSTCPSRPARRSFFSRGAELFRRPVTRIARSGFLRATIVRCHLIVPECPSNDFESDKHGTPRLLARNAGSPCGEMGGAIRYPSLSTPESLAVDGDLLRALFSPSGKRYCTVQFIRVP